MSELPPPNSRANLLLLIWAATATVAAVILCALVIFLSLKLYHTGPTSQVVRTAPVMNAPPPPKRAVAQPGPSPFETLQDSDVIGRYRFFQEGEELGKITLLPTHSIINKDGTTYPSYHWEIQPDGIMTTWQRGNILLNKLERPGVYVAVKKDGSESMRIEKLSQ